MRKRIRSSLLLCLMATFSFAAKLESIQLISTPPKMSILFTLTNPVAPKVFTLNNPHRLVVDFAQTTGNIRPFPQSQGVITHVRSGYPNPQTLRLVFETKTPVKSVTHAYVTANSKISRFKIDLFPLANTRLMHANASLKKASLPLKTRPPQSLRDVVIVLDPGHGGKDPGAIGMRRNVEKNVVLAIALKLKSMIDKQPGMRAVLTRRGDYYVGLRERLNIARRANADIFISIHADAFINHHSQGASVFALSPRGATSEAARWLAEKENYSELGGVKLADLDDQNGIIRTVLLDLSQTATISASLEMGSRVLRAMDRITTLHSAKVEQARFVVLKSPDIPSILVETGFITNPSEERNLSSPLYQSRLTNSLFDGIKRYFWDYPPAGTRLEAMVGSKLHVVRNGESLPLIAKRYQVSAKILAKTNHLTSYRLHPGQKLSIPA